MPFVGKDLKTLEFQKQRHLEELKQKSENRLYFLKNKQHTEETGSSITAKKYQPTTLEQYLDLSKIDTNLEGYLIKELGTNQGQAKVFIQGLDENLKKFLLDRLPAFKKVFNDNFTVPTATNLKSAFELFNRQQIEKMKDIDIPTRADLDDYLADLNRPRLYNLGLPIYVEDMQKSVRMSPNVATRRFNNDYDYLSGEDDPEQETRILVRDIILNYIRSFENPIDGWMATYQVAQRAGLRDFPKPQLKENRADLTSTIRTPISEFDVDESRSSDYTIRGSPISEPRSEWSGFSTPTSEIEQLRPIPPPGRPSRNQPESVRRIRGLREATGDGFVKIYKLKK